MGYGSVEGKKRKRPPTYIQITKHGIEITVQTFIKKQKNKGITELDDSPYEAEYKTENIDDVVEIIKHELKKEA